MFRGRIGSHVRVALQPGDGGDRDQPAPVAALQLPNAFTQRQEHAGEVDRHDLIPHVQAGARQRCAVRHARVGNDYVDVTGLGEQSCDVVFVGDVGDRHADASRTAGNCLQRLTSATRDDDVGPLCGEPTRKVGALARATTGDEHSSAVQLYVVQLYVVQRHARIASCARCARRNACSCPGW